MKQKNEEYFCDSLQIAESFKRRHNHVLRTIHILTDSQNGLSEEFIKANFTKTSYKDNSGKRNIKYLLTQNGATITIMDFKTARARRFKEAYINQINALRIEDILNIFLKTNYS